jgi:hypothetical protein
VIQLVPGHGWADVIALVAVFCVAAAGFFAGLALLVSLVDLDADGQPERWPGQSR